MRQACEHCGTFRWVGGDDSVWLCAACKRGETESLWVCEGCGVRGRLRCCPDCREKRGGIRTPVEDSRYGAPVNPPSMQGAERALHRHVTGNEKNVGERRDQ